MWWLMAGALANLASNRDQVRRSPAARLGTATAGKVSAPPPGPGQSTAARTRGSGHGSLVILDSDGRASVERDGRPIDTPWGVDPAYGARAGSGVPHHGAGADHYPGGTRAG